MKPIALLLIAATMATSCTKNHNGSGSAGTGSVQKLTFGSYAAFCVGYCASIYQVDGSTLQKDDSAYARKLDWSYTFTSRSYKPSAKQAIAATLLSGIPSELFSNNDKVYGCPDCRDQGGYYIMFQNSGITRRFKIDPDSTADQTPAMLAYKKKLISVLEQLQ